VAAREIDTERRSFGGSFGDGAARERGEGGRRCRCSRGSGRVFIGPRGEQRGRG
jgi:hypothetical protein